MKKRSHAPAEVANDRAAANALRELKIAEVCNVICETYCLGCQAKARRIVAIVLGQESAGKRADA